MLARTSPGSLLGQLNEADTVRWQLSATLGGAWQTGNVDLGILRASAGWLTQTTGTWVYKSQNNLLLQRFGEFTADRDLLSRHFLYFHPRQRLYPFAIATVESSLRRQLDWRVFGGAGLTLSAVQKPGHSIKASLSLFYESSEYAAPLAATGTITLRQWRLAPYLSGHHRFGQYLHLWYLGFVLFGRQPEWSNRWHLEAGAEVRLSARLSASAQYQFTREAFVPEPTRLTDGVLTYGLRISLSPPTP